MYTRFLCQAEAHIDNIVLDRITQGARGQNLILKTCLFTDKDLFDTPKTSRSRLNLISNLVILILQVRDFDKYRTVILSHPRRSTLDLQNIAGDNY